MRLQFQAVRSRFDFRVAGVFRVRIRILDAPRRGFVDALEVHSQPHDALLELGDGQRPFTARRQRLHPLNDGVGVPAQFFVRYDFCFDVHVVLSFVAPNHRMERKARAHASRKFNVTCPRLRSCGRRSAHFSLGRAGMHVATLHAAPVHRERRCSCIPSRSVLPTRFPVRRALGNTVTA